MVAIEVNKFSATPSLRICIGRKGSARASRLATRVVSLIPGNAVNSSSKFAASLPRPSLIASRWIQCSRSAQTSSQFCRCLRTPFGSSISFSTLTPSLGKGAPFGISSSQRIIIAAGALAITRFHSRSTTSAGYGACWASMKSKACFTAASSGSDRRRSR
ncbi:hypothetical protein D3C72_1709960 [compost metagenome]